MLGIAFPMHGVSAWVSVVCLMASVASFAVSLGPIVWLLISEIYPLKIRGLAQGTASTANWAANLLVSMTFLTLIQLARTELDVLALRIARHRLLGLLTFPGA